MEIKKNSFVCSFAIVFFILTLVGRSSVLYAEETTTGETDLFSYFGMDNECPEIYYEKVKIHDGVTQIDKNTFFDEVIGELYIPSSVTHIDDYAFGWSWIWKIIIDPENECYKESDGCIVTYDGEDLLYYRSGDNGKYYFPDGIKDIHSGAVSCCGINEPNRILFLPDGLEYICSEAFNYCYFEEAYFPDSVKKIDCDAFLYGELRNSYFAGIPDYISDDFFLNNDIIYKSRIYFCYETRDDLFFDFELPHTDEDVLQFWHFVQNGQYDEAMAIQKVFREDSSEQTQQDASERATQDTDAVISDEPVAEDIPTDSSAPATVVPEESAGSGSIEPSPKEENPAGASSITVSAEQNYLGLIIVAAFVVTVVVILLLKHKRK